METRQSKAGRESGKSKAEQGVRELIVELFQQQREEEEKREKRQLEAMEAMFSRFMEAMEKCVQRCTKQFRHDIEEVEKTVDENKEQIEQQGVKIEQVDQVISYVRKECISTVDKLQGELELQKSCVDQLMKKKEEEILHVMEKQVHMLKKEHEVELLNMRREILEMQEHVNQVKLKKEYGIEKGKFSPNLHEVVSGKTENLSEVVKSKDEVVGESRVQIGLKNCKMMMKFIQPRDFYGRSRENPLEFIQSCEDLFRIQQMEEGEKIMIVTNQLKENARTWWASMYNPPRTFHGFKRAFLENYWSDEKQDAVRHRISQEKYDKKSDESLVDFFRRQVAELKTLYSYDFSEVQVLKMVRKNLPRELNNLLLFSGLNDVEPIADLLASIELEKDVCYGTERWQVEAPKSRWKREEYPGSGNKKYQPSEGRIDRMPSTSGHFQQEERQTKIKQVN